MSFSDTYHLNALQTIMRLNFRAMEDVLPALPQEDVSLPRTLLPRPIVGGGLQGANRARRGIGAPEEHRTFDALEGDMNHTVAARLKMGFCYDPEYQDELGIAGFAVVGGREVIQVTDGETVFNLLHLTKSAGRRGTYGSYCISRLRACVGPNEHGTDVAVEVTDDRQNIRSPHTNETVYTIYHHLLKPGQDSSQLTYRNLH